MNFKKITFLASFFLIVPGSCVFGQEDIVKDGYVKFYYPNGNISSEGNMKSSKPDGYWKSYYEKGTIKSEGNRENFKLKGQWKFYDEKSVLINVFNYREGKKDSTQISYYESGIIKSEENDSMDVLSGVSKYYNANGKLQKQVNFINGIESGLAKEFSADGLIVTLTTYRNGYIVKEEKINRTDRFGMKQGTWKELYENDSPKSEGFFRDGKRDGFFKEYDRNGRVVKKEEYRNDILMQTVQVEQEKYDVKKIYYHDGTVKSIGTYKKGLPEGVFREYDSKGNLTDTASIYTDGRLSRQGKLDDQGREQGVWKEFFEDGKVKSEGSYKEGKREGLWSFFYNNQQTEQAGEYVKGKPSGEWKKFFADGKLQRNEFYENGKENGIMTEYSSDSIIIAQGNYVEGKKDGLWKFNNGEYRGEGKFAEDKEEGNWKQFYADRKLAFEGDFVEGQENGEHKYLYEDGKPKETRLYRLGIREGVWRKYDSAGILIIEITYSNGNEIKLNGTKISLGQEKSGGEN
ncbi:MAG TPA: toxin-antitoxin system YwqK family antitoxin [Bacteroidia bacterium]|nr:toxin-antitoxin system YwqK family antitoxin [Bacteroidia bacterium]